MSIQQITVQQETVTRELTAEEFARQLIDQGFFQVSRRCGHLARVPLGKTAVEALYEAEYNNVAPHTTMEPVRADWKDDVYRWAERLGEVGARRQYCRVYATGTDHVIVSDAVMKAFRRLGGVAA